MTRIIPVSRSCFSQITPLTPATPDPNNLNRRLQSIKQARASERGKPVGTSTLRGQPPTDRRRPPQFHAARLEPERAGEDHRRLLNERKLFQLIASPTHPQSPRGVDPDDASGRGGRALRQRRARQQEQEQEQEEDVVAHEPEQEEEEDSSSPPGSFALRGPLTQGGDYVGLSRVYGLLAGLALVGVRLLGAAVNPVADCDETYN